MIRFLLLAWLGTLLGVGARAGEPDDGTEASGLDGVTRFESELIFWAIPAPKPMGLTWRGPGPLARRTLFNEGLGLSRAIGHLGVRVSCAASDTRPAGHFQGSMTHDGPDFRKMVLGEKAGLGVLFRTVPGRVETEEELQATVDERSRKGRMSYLRIGISSETCHPGGRRLLGLLPGLPPTRRSRRAVDARGVAVRCPCPRAAHRR
ncbi:MAG: hypothetical protein JRI25_30030 [Deltaproteobacteria bacterium]|nr:hypothetical protein [Deltaproteobacteria bacterium]